MKYIKTYEEKEIISQQEKKLNNLARRIERNINKYFDIKNKSDLKYIYVRSNKLLKNEYIKTDYDIAIYTTQFFVQNSDREKFIKFDQYFKDKKIKHSSIHEYQLTSEEAKYFLNELKAGFIYSDIEKYNL